MPKHLARTSRKKSSEGPKTNAPPILLLPVDVLLLFGDALQPADLLSPSLTCKTMLTIFPLSKSKYDSLETDEKSTFLESLERDVGDTHTFCSKCTKLHRFSRDLHMQFYQSILSPCSPGFSRPIGFWTRGRACLHYQEARLLAINHRYGSPKGINPQDFLRKHLESPSDQSLRSSRPLDRWHVIVDVKFHHSQLLLKATHRLHGSSFEEATRNRKISEHGLCAHAFALPRKPARPYPNDWKAISVSDAGVPVLNATTSCPECTTEWTIDACFGERSIDIKLETYHLFGDISSHEDSLWMLMANRRPAGPWSNGVRPEQARASYRDGSIKAMWELTI